MRGIHCTVCTYLPTYRYVHKMETSERSLTIKIKICHLISSIMQHLMDLNFRAEVQFRNQVAEYLSVWMRGEVVISENPSHVETLQKLVWKVVVV